MHGDTPGGPIRWRMFIPVPRERVFEALASDAGRASFWAESAVETGDEQGGAVIDFVFGNGWRQRCRIVERVPPARFALDYFEGVARFDLAEAPGGGTDLLLTHEGVPAPTWCEVHAGWLNVLFPLKASLACGADLRNHDPARSWDQGYADG